MSKDKKPKIVIKPSSEPKKRSDSNPIRKPVVDKPKTKQE